MNRRNHDLAVVAIELRECLRINRLKCGQIPEQPATVCLMSGQRKVFQLTIVLVKTGDGRLRGIGFEVVFKVRVNQLVKRARLGVD